MTERLAEINARIDGIRQLGQVVNAMRGMAAARAQQARGQLVAVDTYAATIAAAIGSALPLLSATSVDAGHRKARPALVVFCAEQGFAGAFSDRVLDVVEAEPGQFELFLIGTRGGSIAAERGIVAGWSDAMPSNSFGVPKLADAITEALYARIAAGEIDRLDAVFSQWQQGQGIKVVRRHLLPVDLSTFARPTSANPPLTNLNPDTLMRELTADYIHAQLCHAALHAFAAENEARMESMAAARSQIERQLGDLQATQRRVRQEEITAEIIELATGEMAVRRERRETR